MLKIGLTGGIACGKSTVSGIIATLGIPVLDADQVARDIVTIGSEGLFEIRQHFGEDICLDNGELNRPKLREIIIADPEKRQVLESITHPKIFMNMLKWQQRQQQQGCHATLVEAALMIETGSYKMYDAVIVTTCSVENQLSRLMARNKVSQEIAQQWINSQMPLAQKEAIGDVVIENNGTLTDLHEQTTNAWNQLLNKLQSTETSDIYRP